MKGMIKMIYKRETRPGFITLFLVLMLFSTHCTRKVVSPISIQETKLEVLSVRDFWFEAFDTAREWHSDVYVRDVNVDVSVLSQGENSSDQSSGVNFRFRSLQKKDSILVVHCTLKNCYSFEVKNDQAVDLYSCRAIELEDFVFDSQEVFDIGLDKGGGDYLESKTTSVVLKLYRDSPICSGPVRWYVSFLDVSTQEGVAIIVDAVTGKVIQVNK